MTDQQQQKTQYDRARAFLLLVLPAMEKYAFREGMPTPGLFVAITAESASSLRR